MIESKYAFCNGIVLSGNEDMEPVYGKVILVSEGKIEKLADAGCDLTEYEVVDLQGRYIMPGLINLHVHLPGSGKPKKKETDPKKAVKLVTSNNLFRKIAKILCTKMAQTALYSGVTTIRTVGGIENIDSTIRDEINAGKLSIPRRKDMKLKTKLISLIAVFVMLAALMLSGCSTPEKQSLSDYGEVKEGSVELNRDSPDGALNLDIDLCIADFSLSFGDAFRVNYIIPEKLIPRFSMDGDTLSINGQNGNEPVNLGIDSIDELKKLGKNGSESFMIELVLPENTELGSISINIDMGNASLRELSCSELTASVDMGNITLDKISCENLSAEADMGDVEITGVACETVEASVDMGSADISGDFAKISAECSMGGITINTDRPEDEVEINLDVDMGEAIINGKQAAW